MRIDRIYMIDKIREEARFVFSLFILSIMLILSIESAN